MEDNDRNPTLRIGVTTSGLSVAGAMLTGAGGLLGGFVATGNGEFVGGGLYLIAAALAFGLVANAVFRR